MASASVPPITCSAADSKLPSALHKAKMDVPLAALDVFVPTLVRGVVGNTLPAGVQVGETGGRLRCHKVRSA